MPVLPHSSAVYTLKEYLFSFFDTVIWWYTDGCIALWRWVQQKHQAKRRTLALRFWTSHLFESMYGQHDLTGRIISVVMRFVVLIGRLISLFFSTLGYTVILVLWFISPAISLVLLLQGIALLLGMTFIV